MICVSIQGRNLAGIRQALAEGLEMAEIRLDRCPLSLEDIETLFSETDIPLVATCRAAECGGEQEAGKRLEAAIRAGARYVDLEIEASAALAEKIGSIAEEAGARYIRSFHDFGGTPAASELKAVMERCFDEGADLAKIVTTATDDACCDRVMELYETATPGSLLAFCMGEAGRATRLACLVKGAPYTYCALTEEEAAAPGQWAWKDMAEAVYGGRTFPGHRTPQEASHGREISPFSGPGSCGVASASRTIAIPCSKSYAQRAILAAALADGVSHLEGYSPCGDNESAIALVKSLGAGVERDGSRLTVKGIAARPGTLAVDSVHVGESGFLTRMTVPLMAVLNGKALKVTGEKTLVGRPLKGAAQAMAAFGSQLRNADPGADAPLTVPLTIESPLAPGEATVSGRDGSQIISGLMAALPLLDKDSIIHVKDPRSVPYLLVTLDVLNSFGIEVDSITADGDIDFEMKGGQRYHAADFRIEGDWSSAANFLVAGAIFGSADVSGLELGSLQADSAILEILAEAGAIVYQTEEGTVHVQKAPLTAFETDANDCPDIFPIVALLAAFSEGVSAINGTGRLAGKESDRAAAILTMLQQMGVKAAIERDTMYIEGHSLQSRLLSGNLLKGGSYTSGHDHRMVMALKVASLGADGPIIIDDTDCVSKSFPTFLKLFESFLYF
ncbi:MAG: 3-phosphoshikimate 1-carboxyvinyltransferase [Bacteroidales bacterium]|nr:3-phosphoshikimate 1-carboxyvinyltransferase [Bacteroidales bacterium]